MYADSNNSKDQCVHMSEQKLQILATGFALLRGKKHSIPFTKNLILQIFFLKVNVKQDLSKTV